MMIKTNVMRILEDNNIEYIPYTYSVDEKIDAISISQKLNKDIKMVYKTIVLNFQKDYFVCVINAKDEIDLKKVAKILNVKNVSLINLNDLPKVTGGYIRGGTSPIGMKKLYKTLISKDALLNNTIIVSAGKRGVQVEIKPKDLIALLNAIVCDIRK